MKVTLEHANITVKSISQATELIGTAFPDFRVRGRGYMHGIKDLGEWIHFGTDETYIAFQQNRTHSGRNDTTYTHDGINHVGFVVDSLDDVVARLGDAGFQPTSIEKDHPHRQRIYYHDGNGIEWEFVEYLSEEPEERNDYLL